MPDYRGRKKIMTRKERIARERSEAFDRFHLFLVGIMGGSLAALVVTTTMVMM